MKQQKDFVTTDQLAKADDARALATENGKTMAEKAHKLGVELVEYITKDEALQPSVFTDVKEGAYYVDAVNWAVDKKVTSGKTETTFAPNDSCTRAQAVTFLWRAAGSPEPTASEMTFTDVKADSYYYKAVLWAVENKITSGMSDTLFAPDATCSRSQIVTFLYRMQNSPESKAENPFTDVKADAYYANAVLWAVENGVTTGASATTFDPRGRLHARSDRHFPLSLPEQVSDKSKQESPRRNPSGAFFAERVGEISTEVDVALRKSSSACGKNIKSDVVSSGGDARR